MSRYSHAELFKSSSRDFSKLKRDWFDRLTLITQHWGNGELVQDAGFVAQVKQAQMALSQLDNHAFQNHLHQVRQQLRQHGFLSSATPHAFALVSLQAQKVLNQLPYHTQLLAARGILQGNLAEMATGEGKTLAMGLAGAVAGMSGFPVYVMTSNDYLAARDAESLKPLYDALGLSVSMVYTGMPADEKKQAYSANIIYATAKTIAFEYLIDQTQAKQAQQAGRKAQANTLPGLYIALLDEADSLLIDEASTPLILSTRQQHSEQIAFYQQSLAVAQQLEHGLDYALNPANKSAFLTPQGKLRVNELSVALYGLWRHEVYREEAVGMALSALHLYQPNIDYLIQKHAKENQIQIIDVMTGRLAEGRMWAKGLHQMIELKEGLVPSGEMVTLAQITFQRFFNLFHHLGGMSGTLAEVQDEVLTVYGLSTVVIPLHQPSRRVAYPIRVFKQIDAMYAYLASEVIQLQKQGRATLVGTDSVRESQDIAQRIQQAGIACQVLNALADKEEAALIAKAGQAGAVTIATNMAGRGTDIKLATEVRERGGLHVLSCQFNDAYRNDRQLIGRAARHGDPGSYQYLFMLDKAYPKQGWISALAGILASGPQLSVKWAFFAPKKWRAHLQKQQRIRLYEQDLEEANRLLSLNQDI